MEENVILQSSFLYITYTHTRIHNIQRLVEKMLKHAPSASSSLVKMLTWDGSFYLHCISYSRYYRLHILFVFVDWCNNARTTTTTPRYVVAFLMIKYSQRSSVRIHWIVTKQMVNYLLYLCMYVLMCACTFHNICVCCARKGRKSLLFATWPSERNLLFVST